jgi:hypothetical protein
MIATLFMTGMLQRHPTIARPSTRLIGAALYDEELDILNAIVA